MFSFLPPPSLPFISPTRTFSPPVCSLPSTYDVVIIGSGIGGLSTAALLSSSYARSVCVLEAHTELGGAAHAFTRHTPRGTFTFHSGPHLFSGLSPSLPAPLSPNPLLHVLRATDTPLPVIPYSTWGVFLPNDVYVPTSLSTSEPLFDSLLQSQGGPNARKELDALLDAMKPLCKASTLIPPALLRAGDIWGSLRTMRRVMSLELLQLLPNVSQVSKPFGPFLRRYVKDEFTINFINLLCFLLAGVEVDMIPTAEVAFMFAEWTGEGAMGEQGILQHPVGGASGIVDALVQTIQKSEGCSIRVGCEVTKIVMENGRANGVQLANGEVISARQAVVGNCSIWNFKKLIGERGSRMTDMPEMLPSFVHLHVAVELTATVKQALPHTLEANYACVESWERGVSSEGNVILISIPSVLEPDKYPTNFAVLHAYAPATEKWAGWDGVEHGSGEYKQLKQRKCAALWRAVNKVFGQDIREKAYIKMEGTPITTARFLHKPQGTYGPKVDARKDGLGLPFGKRDDLMDGLWTAGEGSFPGIGVPAVAASAWLAANGMVRVDEHEQLLDRMGW